MDGEQEDHINAKPLDTIMCCYDKQHYIYTAVQSQKAVSAYFASKQIPPFAFAEQFCWVTSPLWCLPPNHLKVLNIWHDWESI